MSRSTLRFGSPSRQDGAALIMVLLMLLVITLLGIASMRGAIMQERMAGATLGRSLAFHAAESALREAEAVAAKERPVPPSAGCDNGVCARTAPGAAPVWRSEAFWSDSSPNNFKTATSVNGATSRYVLEDYGLSESPDCAASVGTNPLDMSAPACSAELRVYRIIARSRTPAGSEVMLQSLFRAP